MVSRKAGIEFAIWAKAQRAARQASKAERHRETDAKAKQVTQKPNKGIGAFFRWVKYGIAALIGLFFVLVIVVLYLPDTGDDRLDADNQSESKPTPDGDEDDEGSE